MEKLWFLRVYIGNLRLYCWARKDRRMLKSPLMKLLAAVAFCVGCQSQHGLASAYAANVDPDVRVSQQSEKQDHLPILDVNNRLPVAYRKLAHDIFRELVEINTTSALGTQRAAEVLRARLITAGIDDVKVLGPSPEKANLIVRLPGTGKKRPLLFIAHLDVVDARREDWTFDPFQLTEHEGYLYGRGTIDIKNEVTNLVVNLIRLKAEGFRGDRDIILALTADEEVGGEGGIQWLLQNHRTLIDAEFCVNPDAGGGDIKDGKHIQNSVQTAEKVYLSLQLEVRNRGGHSSEPTKDNAIYHLAEGLARLAKFEFPIHVNETTAEYFGRLAEKETGLIAEDMRAVGNDPSNTAAAARLCAASASNNALLRTTAVATQITGGHAENALPQRATAIVNCRILPEESPDEVQATIVQVLQNDQIEVTKLTDPLPSPSSPIDPAIFQVVEQVTTEMWPGVLVLPVMTASASDGLHVRSAGIPVYGISGMFYEDEDSSRAHGQNERIAIASFFDGIEFMYRLMKALISAK